MNGLEIFFEKAGEFHHPKVPAWTALIHEGNGDVSCEVVRHDEGFGFRPTRLCLHSRRGPNPVTEDEEWDDELNRFLLAKQIRAITPENEALRCALMLKSNLSRPEIRYGTGYFNSVLLEMVGESFKDNAPIIARLRVIRPSNPNRGRVYADCVAMIREAIATGGLSLLQDLHYSRPEAEAILALALGHYLDERFSLEDRKRLGL